MVTELLSRILRPPSGSFQREARARGLSVRVAKLLEPAAREISADQPARILESRELLEQAAMLTVAGDSGNLELSFRRVDLLASAAETLGLIRSSDVPDVFRRVWVGSKEGARTSGVVFVRREEEISVLCPPDGHRFSGHGTVLNLEYRGFSAPVRYALQLNDSVLLPNALILHLNRLEGQGAIGRQHPRFPVDLTGRVRAVHAAEGEEQGEFVSCLLHDISAGGVRVSFPVEYDNNRVLALEIDLPDGDGQFLIEASVRWRRVVGDDGMCHGLLFSALPAAHAQRLDRFLLSQTPPVPT